MPVVSAQSNFKRGLAAILEENYRDAAVFFQRAMEIERQRRVRRPEMRYLSYYGLSLAKARQSFLLGLEACRRAVEQEPADPDLFLNLGLVHSIAGDTPRAVAAYERGLRIAPRDRLLLRELARVDRRSSSVLPALARQNPLNRWLGRLRHRRRSRAGAWLPAAGLRETHS